MSWKEIPERYLGTIIHFLMNFHNDTSEFSHPHLRKSFKNSYKFFIFIYGLLIVAGIAANIVMLRQLYLLRPHALTMYKYLAFNSLNDILKCAVVLPLALCTTLFQNWVYGSFMCYLFPMLQDVPFHASMLTFVLIAFDRYRQTLYPLKPPLPASLGLLSVWVATILAVFPYAVYIRYLDLEIYFGVQFKGSGICTIIVENNIEEYIRCLFILMYVLPLGLIAFLHIKASEEMKVRQSACTVSFHGTQDTVTVPLPDPKDWNLEKQSESFLSSAVTAYAVCLLPLNLVRLLRHVVYETYENSVHLDWSFISVVWIAFVPTFMTPAIFLYLHQPGVPSPNISRYLRLGRSSDVSFSAYDLQKKEKEAVLTTENPLTNTLTT